jgi:hypothetical protein
VFDDLVLDLKTRVHTAAIAAVWGSIAVVSVVAVLFFLCLGTFVWISQHYGWVAASFVLGGFFLIAAVISSFAFIVVRRGDNPPTSPVPTAQRAQWWLDPAVLTMGLQLGRSIGARRLIPVLLVGALGAGWIMSRSPATET